MPASAATGVSERTMGRGMRGSLRDGCTEERDHRKGAFSRNRTRPHLTIWNHRRSSSVARTDDDLVGAQQLDQAHLELTLQELHEALQLGGGQFQTLAEKAPGLRAQRLV